MYFATAQPVHLLAVHWLFLLHPCLRKARLELDLVNLEVCSSFLARYFVNFQWFPEAPGSRTGWLYRRIRPCHSLSKPFIKIGFSTNHHRMEEIYAPKCTSNQGVNWMTRSRKLYLSSAANMRKHFSFSKLNQGELGKV